VPQPRIPIRPIRNSPSAQRYSPIQDSGTNVENASFGLCNCAERTAIFSAVAAGESALRCVVVYTPTKTTTTPCGACRQVINEFGPEARVISICDTEDRIETSLSALLPGAFGPGNLA